MKSILLTLLVLASLAVSACGDIVPTSPSVSTSTGPCQTSGSTVAILDQQPGC